MPEIKIREQESVTLASLEVTNNSVLVPMLWVRKLKEDGSYDDDGKVSAVEYTNAETFRNDFEKGGGKLGAGSRFVYYKAENNAIDKSFIMIYELLLQGLPVVIKPILLPAGTEKTKWNAELGQVVLSEKEYQAILENEIITNNCLKEFKNKNLYNIKFITSGAWPNAGVLYEEESSEGPVASALHSTLSQIAADRGDAVAFIEFKKDFINESELLNYLEQLTANKAYDNYSLAYFPWYVANTTALKTELKIQMPACFGYLMAYANSVKTNANWFAAAGVIRGEIPNFESVLFDVGEDLMRVLQGEASYESKDSQGQPVNKQLKMAINSIMNAGTYGYRIWGNKVYNLNSKVTSDMYMNFANVRLLLCDIKKQVYHAAMRTTFEPNDDIVWINFKSLANTLLEKMKSGRGIVWYKWIKEVAEAKATIKATLTIKPIEAVESFDVNIVLTDEDVTVEEQ